MLDKREKRRVMKNKKRRKVVNSLRRSKHLQRIAGVTGKVFEEIVSKCQPEWKLLLKRRQKSGRPHEIGGLREHLLLILIYYRCHLTHFLLAHFFDVQDSTITRSIKRIAPILNKCVGLKPNRKISTDEALILLLDCTEQRIQRPMNQQREYYSGKKKQHTTKTEAIANEKNKILSFNGGYGGKTHDMEVRRCGQELPYELPVLADSGYQGLQKEHDGMVWIPIKHKKGQKLTSQQRRKNRNLAKCRVGIEHIFGRIKRFRILSDRFRGRLKTYNQIFGNIAGIYNLSLEF